MISKYELFGRFMDQKRFMDELYPSGLGGMRKFGEKYAGSRKAKQNRRKRKKRK
jgi:hypothetical protein